MSDRSMNCPLAIKEEKLYREIQNSQQLKAHCTLEVRKDPDFSDVGVGQGRNPPIDKTSPDSRFGLSARPSRFGMRLLEGKGQR